MKTDEEIQHVFFFKDKKYSMVKLKKKEKAVGKTVHEFFRGGSPS